MNYDEHLARHQAKQEELKRAAEEEFQRRLIAIQEAFKEADGLVESVILPELEALRESLEKYQFPAKISISREVSELSPDSTFDVEIGLREDIHPENPRRGITFTAVPHGKYFTVKSIVSRDHQARPSLGEMKFSETTVDAVKSHCASFVSAAFPV